jgi:aryl-phospho-beta-D-glucosidase BglC (GH1 family)
MKRISILPILIVLFILQACGVPSTAVPTETPTPIPPSPTETAIPPSPTPTITPEPTPTPSASLALQRGINLGNMLEAPNEGEWGLFVEEEYFDLIDEAGFDFVRLPVRWNTHADMEPPYTIDPVFFARVDEAVGWALERDLAVIVDFHHYEEMAWDPWGHKDRYIGIWRQVAEHYREYPPKVLFELLNEPNDQLNAQLWNEYVVLFKLKDPTLENVAEAVSRLQ